MRSIFILIIFFFAAQVAAAEEETTSTSKTDSSPSTEAVSPAEKKSEKKTPDLIEKTLKKVPDMDQEAKKEKIKTRPAAVTRANKSIKTKLPLIWKLDKPTDKADNPSTPAETAADKTAPQESKK